MDVFFFSGRRRHTSSYGDWSSDVCSSDLEGVLSLRREGSERPLRAHRRREGARQGQRLVQRLFPLRVRDGSPGIGGRPGREGGGIRVVGGWVKREAGAGDDGAG